MLILCFLIPFIACLILYFGFRHATVWWEYIVLVFPSILLTLILYFSLKYTGITDTEYLGYYVSKVCYYEPWDEYIHRTCTREVYDGTDSEGHAKYHTETYDCSYVDYHPSEWTIINNVNHERYISKDLYNYICQRFGTPKQFVDMHRHFHTIDGDKYECHFNGDRNRMYTLTDSHYYKNKILKSKSIFNYSEVSEQDKKDYRLFDYPDFSYKNDQCPIMSEVYVPKYVIDSFKYVNAYYGGKYQFRTYVMIWKDAPIETSTYQEDYFVGGNKNELCICISVNNENQIQWVRTFSWEDKPDLEVEINHLWEYGSDLDLMKLNRYLIQNVPMKWHRKAFADFEYINIMLDTWQWILILALTIIYNVGISIYIIKNNNYTEDNPNGVKRSYY